MRVLPGASLKKLKVRPLAVLAAGVIGMAAVAASHAATTSAGVLNVRLGGDALETRIVIDLDRSASGKVAADGADDRRVVLNLPGVSAEGGLQRRLNARHFRQVDVAS
jgi:N-acetylmuramoyl-L-alanine amidase